MAVLRDYYPEYIEELDNLMLRFIAEVKIVCPGFFEIHGAHFDKAVLNYLWDRIFFSRLREYYNRDRKGGIDKDILINDLWEKHFVKLIPTVKAEKALHAIQWNKESSQYNEALHPYVGRKIFYCKNHRQLLYFLPILKKIDEQVLVLAKYVVPENFELPDHIMVIEFNLITDEICVESENLAEYFRQVLHQINTFSILFGILAPTCVIVLEGCHEDMEVIAALCKKQHIPSICIQQGWPSILYSKFQNMKYDYYLTWGEQFNILWSKYNPEPVFKEIGYLYKVMEKSNQKALTFFLQAPLFILDRVYFDEILTFITYCAGQFEQRPIYIREHPEYKLTQEVKADILNYANVRFVSDMPLAELFSQTEISISAFSSTIMEGVIHDVIPFIFNPGSSKGYYPDLQMEGIGIYANSLGNAKIKITELLQGEQAKSELLSNLRKSKPFYFTAHDDNAVENAVNYVKLIADKPLN